MAPNRETEDEFADTGSHEWVATRRNGRKRPDRTVPLRMSVVEYAHQPDRCTVYQADEASTPLTSTWLSVDTSIVESLASRR